ncbi:hypothetical protein THAOC_22249, partial [Thalassiosira oceanica]
MLGDRERSAGEAKARVSLIFSAFMRTNERETATSGKTILKESVFADARRTAPILGFRRFGPWSSDLSHGVASGRSPSSLASRLARQAATHHEVDSRQE